MANKYPLILDTTDGNKIKELPAGDNLYLRNNNIDQVQNITALGIIDAARFTVNGVPFSGQQLTDLVDTPNTYAGSEGTVLRVKSDGSGIEFSALSDLGDVTVGNIIMLNDLYPPVNFSGRLGLSDRLLWEVHAQNLIGDLKARDGSKVFDASTGEITYAAIVGGPTSLSEFTNDTGFITLSDITDDITVNPTGDLQGSVFGDDSTLLVDGVNSKVNTYALSQVEAENGQALVWSAANSRWQPGTVVGGGFDLTAISVGTNATASGEGGLSYNNTTGEFTYTPADLSAYATVSSLSNYVDTASIPTLISSITLDVVTTSGSTTTNSINVGQLTATNVVADALEFTGAGIVTIESGSNLVLNAANGLGNIIASDSRITNVADPTNAQDAATKAYVDTAVTPTLTVFEIDATTVASSGLLGADTILIKPASGYAGSDAQTLGFTGRNVAGTRTLVINSSTLCTVDIDFGDMMGPLTLAPSTVAEVIYTGNSDWFTISTNSI